MQTGDNVLFAGFIVTGTDPKRMILRGIGPSLKVNGVLVAGRLADPVVELYDSENHLITSNDNWKDSEFRSEIEASGLAPTDDAEAAILRVLSPGVYTAIIRGKGDATGIGVIDLYDQNPSSDSTFANISSRGVTETNDNILIGGFIVGNKQGGTKVLAEAIGPSLKPRLANALNDPVLGLFDGNGNPIAQNDNWKDAPNRQAIEDTGAAPTNDAESAIMTNLAPGLYTAIVRGKNDTSGIAVVQIFNVR